MKDAVWRSVAGVERLTLSPVDAAPLSEIKNFLLLQYQAALGTAIHATPLVPALRWAVPGCRIAVAASGFAMDVYRGNPGVEELIETANPLRDLWGAVRDLRARRPFRGEPFVAITTVGNERTRITLLALLSGCAVRVGFTLAPRMFRAPLRFDASMSQIENNLRVLKELGHTARHFEPQVFFTESDLAEARGLIGAGEWPIAILVTQTSVTQRKSWRAERFQAAARFLQKRYGARIVFVGTTAEAAAIDALRAGLPFETVNVAGRTTLPVLAALMSLGAVGLSLDTGPMHIARAVGLPTVIVAPAWSPPVEWLPVGDPRFRILKNAEMPRATPDYVIDEVSVDEVTAALADLMRLRASR